MTDPSSTSNRIPVDYLARDYDSLLQAMRALIPDKLPEWTEYESQADFGHVLLQLFAHMGDILSYYQDRVANESFLTTAQNRQSVIDHLRLIGYRLSTAVPASTRLTVTFPASFTGTVTIQQGDAFATKSQKERKSVRFEYTQDEPLTIDASTLPVEGTVRRFTAGIPVEEGRLIRDEIIGTSDGTPNQRFVLVHSGMILRSSGQAQQVNRDIVLVTERSRVIEEWTLRESLALSKASQRDFALAIDASDRTTILFGDGVFGAIPPRGSQIRATYRVGGGAQGNVGAQSIQTIADAPQLSLEGAKVTNPSAATGGAERESIERAVRHAPGVFRSHQRAVTVDDYQALALDFNGVGKVRAEAPGWNTVQLFVAPAGGGQVSDVLVSNLLAYFEDKRPVTTIIEVLDVDYVPIYVAVDIGIQSYYSRSEMTERVQAAAASLLAFENVDFKQVIYLSKFYEAIEAIEGVTYANITHFGRALQPQATVQSEGRIALSANELPQIPEETEYARGIWVRNIEGGY